MNHKQESPFFIMLKIVSWPFKSFLRILAVVVIVALYIYQAVIVDGLAREIRMLEIEQKQLQNEKAHFEIEIEKLTNIDRIEKLAREKFGLINGGNQVENLVIKKYEKEEENTETQEVQLAGIN